MQTRINYSSSLILMIAYYIIITSSTYIFQTDADPDVLANTDSVVKAGLTATVVHMMLNFLPLPGCRSAF